MISIITICKNNLLGLKKTIDSLRKQTNINFELIIIDGNSHDGTVEFITSLSSLGFKVKWISENDKGIYDAMNKGISLAEYQYIQFLNAGDSLYSKESMLLALKCIENSKFDMYKFGYFYDKHYVERNSFFFLFRHMFNHQSIVYHKKCFEQYAYNIDLKIAGDYDHFIKIINHTRIGYFDFSLIRYEGGGIAEDRKNLSKTWRERTYSVLSTKNKSIKNILIILFSFAMVNIRKIWY